MKTFLQTCLLASCLSVAPLLADTIPQGTDVSLVNSQGESSYRQRAIRAYQYTKEVSKALKTSSYSPYENPTGIFFSAGEEINITLGNNAEGKDIVLLINDFALEKRIEEYPLKAGKNTIKVKAQGLGYLNYRSLKPQEEPEVTVQIEGGRINGLFTLHDSNDTWQNILKNAQGTMLDMIGERVQLVFNLDELRKNCPLKGHELLETYDYIMKLEQDMMGWERYKLHPGNHIFGRNIWGGFMFADGQGAAFNYKTMDDIGSYERLQKKSWGVAHEFGHVNQVRPGMRWVGTAEVSNNIYSIWVNYNLNPSEVHLEHTLFPTEHGKIRGGRMHRYINSAIADKRVWQFMPSPVNYPSTGSAPKPTEEQLLVEVTKSRETFDHFLNLCPFWQLQLYMGVAERSPYFYPDIFQKTRETAETKYTQGEMRINFMKNACDAAKLNLTAFFVRSGMLAPINRWKDDYGSCMMTITPEMVKETIAHAHQYPEPDSKVIYYINANNVKHYRDKTALTQGRAYQPANGKITIAKGDWKGAVAFEVMQGDTIIGVSLLGLGHEDNETTDVYIPAHATGLRAVSWDGKRARIWNK